MILRHAVATQLSDHRQTIHPLTQQPVLPLAPLRQLS